MNEWINAEERIERAQELCEAQRWAEALVEIDKALEINPHVSGWWNSKAYLLDQLGHYQQAIEAYQQCVQIDNQDRDSLNALGVDYVRTGQIMQAIATFEKVQQLDPHYEPAYCHRILLYTELGDFERAEEMFYLAQQLEENCPHCFWHLGCSLWARKDYKRAIFCWKKVLEIEPRYRGAQRRIAEAYRQLGEINLARQYYLAEYRQTPGDVELLLDLGEMLLEAGRVAPALAKFRHALELEPQRIRAYILLGDALSQLGADRQALKTYESALGLDDSMPGLHFKVGERLMRMARFDDAQFHYDQELEIQPHHSPALMAAGNCALERERPDLAQNYFERLIEIDDALPGAYHNLGVCHFLRGEYDDGITHCRQALALKDDYSLAWQKLVLVHIHLGQWRQARQVLEDALRHVHDDTALQRLQRRWMVRRAADWARRLTLPLRRWVGAA